MTLAHLLLFDSNFMDSPFSVPVAGCLCGLGIVVAGVYSGIRKREMQSQERLAAIARGVPIPPTVEELAVIHGRPSADAHMRRNSSRQAGIVLLGVAAGLILFFIALAAILQERNVLCGAAVGLIPAGIGVGLLVDAHLRSREMAETAFNHQAPTQ